MLLTLEKSNVKNENLDQSILHSMNSFLDRFNERYNKNDRLYGLSIQKNDFNSFEHIVDVIMEICDFGKLQATQCAYLVHLKGEYMVKEGSYSEIKTLKDQFVRKKIEITISRITR